MNPIKHTYIQVSEEIQLKPIQIEDHQELYDVMKRIYPPAYSNYWKDEGNWYVNSLYNYENLQKELSEKDSYYYFVCVENQVMGIMRVVYHIDIYNQNNLEYVKLHRLYLDQSLQNRGIGKQLMHWLFKKTNSEGYPKIWLDAMEMQPQALYFYKKLGFEIVDKVSLEFPLLFDDYRGMFKMVKELY